MNFNNIVKSVDSIAPLSNAIIEIQKLFNNMEELDIHKLIALIESDIVLSGNILKMANSPLYGFSTKISSVSQAVTLFGIMQIYGFIMSYSINENIKANTEVYDLSNEKFNNICNMQSALLLQWYSKIDLEDARFLAPLALIMETGKLVVSSEVIASDYESEFKVGLLSSKSTVEYEEELVGISSYSLSAKVFKHWHLDPIYIRVLENLSRKDSISQKIQNYTDILYIVITAVNVKSVLTKKSVLKACKLVQKMGLDPNEFAQTALEVKKAYLNER